MSRDLERAFFYESFANEWDGRMNPDELQKRLRLIFGGLLKQTEVRGRQVLDAGAGTGHFSQTLRRWGADVTALEVGPKLLEQVLRKCEVKAIEGSVLSIPLPSGSFDVVLSTEVIEHTEDPRKAVSELCRVLRPGGILILTVPNSFWKPAVIVANAIGLRPYEGYENWVRYGAIASWVQAAEMEIELQFGFNVFPHTFFCKPVFDVFDKLRPLHPFMINIALRAKKVAS